MEWRQKKKKKIKKSWDICCSKRISVRRIILDYIDIYIVLSTINKKREKVQPVPRLRGNRGRSFYEPLETIKFPCESSSGQRKNQRGFDDENPSRMVEREGRKLITRRERERDEDFHEGGEGVGF